MSRGVTHEGFSEASIMLCDLTRRGTLRWFQVVEPFCRITDLMHGGRDQWRSFVSVRDPLSGQQDTASLSTIRIDDERL
jgi:hypothetical protein